MPSPLSDDPDMGIGDDGCWGSKLASPGPLGAVQERLMGPGNRRCTNQRYWWKPPLSTPSAYELAPPVRQEIVRARKLFPVWCRLARYLDRFGAFWAEGADL
jgi:hypothetical protein